MRIRIRTLLFAVPAFLLAPLTASQVACGRPPAAEVPATQPATQPATDEIVVLRTLHATGRHEEAVRMADQLLAASAAKAGAWSLSFDGQGVEEAFLGQSVGYFRVWTRTPRPPVLKVDPKHQPANARQFDALQYITAVDLATGKALWTRSVVPHPRVAIDPRDDSLWVWHEKEGWYEQIDPRSAETRRRGEVPNAHVTPGALECLLDEETELWARTTRNTRNAWAATRYDLATREVREDWPRPFARSPGGLRVMTYSSSEYQTTFGCSPTAGGQAVWSYRVPDTTYNPPTWIERDALLLAGGPYAPGVLHRVDGETGEARWQAAVGSYVFCPTMVQLIGGDYPGGGWLPYGVLGDEVWVVDLANQLRFFRAGSGEPTRTLPLGAAALAPPRFDEDGALTVATVRGFQRMVAERERPRAGEVAAIRIKSLAALGKPEDVQAAIRAAVASAQTPDDWEQLAAALEAGGDLSAGTGARVHAMDLARQIHSPALQRSHGLVARLPSGPAAAAGPVVIGPSVLLADKDGTVRTIDPAAGAETARETVAGGIMRWSIQGTQLIAEGGDGQQRVVRELARAPDLGFDDPLRTGRREEPLNSKNIDRAWYSIGGGIGRAQRVAGRLVRPTRGGGVRELVDGKLIERPGPHPAMERWNYGMVGDQPVALCEGGVYALDQQLRPDRPLIQPEAGNAGRPGMIVRIAGGDRTIGLVARDGSGATLQIWSRDGKRLIRSEPVRERSDVEREGGRLLRVGAGYLLSAGDLVYLPDDPAKPVWRFSQRIDTGGRDDWTDVQATGFGVPRVVGNRLVVAAYRGGIYIFDLAAAGILQ